MSRAVKLRPELELVAEAGDGREALAVIAAEAPDVALIDRALAGLTAEQVLNAVGRDGLGTRVMIIAAEPGAGAGLLGDRRRRGRIPDQGRGCERAVRGDQRRRAWPDRACTPAAGGHRGRDPAARRPRAPVPERSRESEILKLVADGLTAPEIGRRIHLSTATIKTHLQHLYDKLGVSERAAAVAVAMRRGLVE